MYVSRKLSQRSSSQESDIAKPGATTIEFISNAGHSFINHKSMGMYPARAIIRCHVNSCPPSPPESNNVSSDGIFSCPSAVRIMGIFYHSDASHISEPEERSRAGGYFFISTKIENTNSRDAPGEWNSACKMQHHEKYHGISHGSRTGRLI